MSTSITTQPDTIGAGEIRFYDYIQPPLPAGNYTLKANQEVKGVTDGQDPSYVSNQPLLVNGPRFSIEPSTIHTLFPPANQLGNYDNSLPHIVFNNFSLPWSREINPPVSESEKSLRFEKAMANPAEINQIPWIGLLTVYQDDIDSGKVPNPVVMTVNQMLTPSPKVLLPSLGKVINGSDSLTAIDFDINYFQAIAPTIEELPFLAHARGVNTGGKVMLGMNDDGCFSVVIGNRLPKAGVKNYIFLVSYEGHQDHLSLNKMDDYDKIRLVTLGSWQFTCNEARASFKTLMADLCLEGRGGVSLLQLPKEAQTDTNNLAKEALEISYVPLQNNMREGETSTSWYRGPLVAAPTDRKFIECYGPYLYSDRAIHYDPESGLFNHAYSSAWQIGRLLALSDGTFANGFFNWRNAYLKTIKKKSTNEVLKEKAMIIGDVEEKDANIVSGTLSLFTNKFKKVDWPVFETRKEKLLGDHLPGVFSENEVKTLIENDDDPLLELAKKLKN
ncbi:hypothetical protein GKZ90_0006275 [Flavobacterium sp. MC2016-06]|jgi:hypothetical protein|uniref:hypothetical protein n=1 Tax=Flavobacterium sp. MC2016-06 TaxID=2676308 RepID=UPI0012BAA0F6|nr:hypothetical protein [Flavobacterium sp. MC2016-06]MBU3857745.1 hypothetical protein [Flavobacterium sp. MC2016-06]